MNRIEKLRVFLVGHDYKGMQTFNCRNLVGDSLFTVYDDDGITVDYCPDYDYLEIFGLSKEEYNSLSDVLDIRQPNTRT